MNDGAVMVRKGRKGMDPVRESGVSDGSESRWLTKVLAVRPLYCPAHALSVIRWPWQLARPGYLSDGISKPPSRQPRMTRGGSSIRAHEARM